VRDPPKSGTPTLYKTTVEHDVRAFGLLRTCRQINAEVEALLYSRNPFCIPDLSTGYPVPNEEDGGDVEDQDEQAARRQLYRHDLSRCMLRKFGPHYAHVQKLTLVLEKFEFFGKYLDGAYSFLWHDRQAPRNRGDVGEICSAALAGLPSIKELTIAWQVADVCLVCHQWRALFRSNVRGVPQSLDQHAIDTEDAHLGRICAGLLKFQAEDPEPTAIPPRVHFQFLMLHKGLNPKGCSCCLCSNSCEALDPDILNKVVSRLHAQGLGEPVNIDAFIES
jgi:hypothetical protein